MSRARAASVGEEEFGAQFEDARFSGARTWLPAEDPLLGGKRAQIIPLFKKKNNKKAHFYCNNSQVTGSFCKSEGSAENWGFFNTFAAKSKPGD